MREALLAAAKGATLAGPMSATIYARSSNTDLELIAHLYDVAPDGTATRIMEGAVLGSQRELDPRKSCTGTDRTPTWPWQSLTARSARPGLSDQRWIWCWSDTPAWCLARRINDRRTPETSTQ
ncbi:CocE/NonD family hydrolase C-terminal non-catalytic domain-containing protein [Saccharopolyspora sp. 5N102]|uniref:CocE/NonD family hydrolase C-terminal non-catalytic domain-containing protein n=1 Tax=Saccharopolyspora sp. 5N102 TaxID=3375155 RepID=UPI00378C59F4